VCPTELISFSDRIQEFLDINCEVVACSTDSEYCHSAWIDTPRKRGGVGLLNIPLLSDITKKISQNFGILDEEAGVARRGLFIVDGSNLLRHVCVHDNGVGRSVDETLRVINAIQYTDKFGEVCPANWKPGDDTIKPKRTSSVTYSNKPQK
jgi:alkyl hydroperoxide reductase subunit AhpC